jgi:ankyrin repeat protein
LTVFKRPCISVFVFLSILLVPAFSDAAPGQEERGTVKVDSLPVYAEMSKDSDVVATLPRGKLVRIAVTATNGSGSWCSIVDIDTSEKLGFVRCDDLDLQNAPSTGASPTGSLPIIAVGSVFSNQFQSHDQELWALAASSILSTANHWPVDKLSPGIGVLEARRMMRDTWDVANSDDLMKMFDWVDRGGYRQQFSMIGARTQNLTPEVLSKAATQLDPESLNSVLVAHRYYGKYSSQSITGYDYGRYINACRVAVAAGYISEEDAWPRVLHAARILQQTFTSWKEYGENYLIGREFFSLYATKKNGQEMRVAYQGLLSRANSPWNRIAWDLSLQAEAAQPNAPRSSPDVGSAESSAAGIVCGALLRAAKSGDSSTMESTLQTKPDELGCRDARGWTPLHHAAFNGKTAIIQMLVAYGAVVDATDKDGATPLHAAASSGHSQAVELLLQKDARINALDHHGNTPLLYAEAAGNAEAAQMLLEHHASTEARGAKGETPLCDAAMRGNADMVRLLIEGGANVNGRSSDGFPPLTEATANGNIEAAAVLLQHGARIDAGDTHGLTALHNAAFTDRVAVIEFLIAHGADIEARSIEGDTPLHMAARGAKMDAAKLLLAKGAHINARNKQGSTPLHYAAAFGHVQMTEFLIDQGADLKLKTIFGCTPLKGAYDWHQAATAQVIVQHGGTQ